MEAELAYYDVAVQLINHNTTSHPPIVTHLYYL